MTNVERFDAILGDWLDQLANADISPDEQIATDCLKNIEQLNSIRAKYIGVTEETKSKNIEHAIGAVSAIANPISSVLSAVAVPVLTLFGGAKVLKFVQTLEQDEIFTPLDCRLIMRVLGSK